ncbi:hypothetical protein C0993_008693, partial [Termitomyces sp. T159_Od127]
MDIAQLQGKLEVLERNYSDLLKKLDQLASLTSSLTSKTAMESLKQEDYLASIFGPKNHTTN